MRKSFRFRSIEWYITSWDSNIWLLPMNVPNATVIDDPKLKDWLLCSSSSSWNSRAYRRESWRLCMAKSYQGQGYSLNIMIGAWWDLRLQEGARSNVSPQHSSQKCWTSLRWRQPRSPQGKSYSVISIWEYFFSSELKPVTVMTGLFIYGIKEAAAYYARSPFNAWGRRAGWFLTSFSLKW